MRSAMPAARQLPRRGSLMWMMPLYANQKSDYDDIGTFLTIVRILMKSNKPVHEPVNILPFVY